MQAGMYISYTGARAVEKKLEQIANNLANVSSAGYKEDRSVASGVAPAASAADIARLAASGEAPAGGKLLYATPALQYVNLQPGALRSTGRAADLAIDGDGYFAVRTREGERLTRAGNFRIDGEGDLATLSGEKVLGQGGPIRVGDGAFAVTADGRVSVDGSEVDALKIVKPTDPSRLRKTGSSQFAAEPGAGIVPASADVRVVQGSVEESNVSAIGGMTEMIEASRMFDAYMKMMTTISEMNSKASSDLGRV